MSEAAQEMFESRDNGWGTIIHMKMNIPSADTVKKPVSPDYSGRQKKGVGTRTVHPYESYFQIRDVLAELEWNKKYRDYALMMFGLSTGLRISDLVGLKVRDVYDVSSSKFREVLDIKEKKTGKSTVSEVDATIISEAAVQGLTKYFDYLKWQLSPDDPLFRSEREGKAGVTHLSECQGWRIVKGATKDAKIDINAGSHTLRKTFLNIANAVGTSSVLNNGSGMVLSDVMVLARHSRLTTTLRYTTMMKSRLVSLRRGVSAFLLGKTKVKNLRMEYTWEDGDL
jgi:integrase